MNPQVQSEERIVESRLGKRPISIPKGVTVKLDGLVVEAQGPKGKLVRTLPAGVDVAIAEGEARVTPALPGREGRRVQGLARAIVHNMVKGVEEGYTKTLELRGTGYRAEVKGQDITMSLGLSHQVRYTIPEGVTATIPGDSRGTVIVLSGSGKELVGQIAATLRGFRPPEPYAGKGIRYRGERVREKAGKTGRK